MQGVTTSDSGVDALRTHVHRYHRLRYELVTNRTLRRRPGRPSLYEVNCAFIAAYECISRYKARTSNANAFKLWISCVIEAVAVWRPMHADSYRVVCYRAALRNQSEPWWSCVVGFLAPREAHRILSVNTARSRALRQELASNTQMGFTSWTFWNAVHSISKPFMFGNERWWSGECVHSELTAEAEEMRDELRGVVPARHMESCAGAAPLFRGPSRRAMLGKRKRSGYFSWEAIISAAEMQCRRRSCAW